MNKSIIFFSSVFYFFINSHQALSLCRDHYNKFDPICHSFCPQTINVYNDAIITNLISKSYNEAKGYEADGFQLACRISPKDSRQAYFLATPNAAGMYTMTNKLCHELFNWINKQNNSKSLATFSFNENRDQSSVINSYEAIGPNGAILDQTFPGLSDVTCKPNGSLKPINIKKNYF